MKQRVISGVFIALITIFTVYFGGIWFQGILTFIALWGSYEFCKCRKRKINWLEYILMAVSVILINVLFDRSLGVILALIVLLLSIAVFDEKYTFNDACVTLVETIVLAYAIYGMSYVRNIDKWLFGYIIIISYLTDVFALFTGMKFGKHKLNERISPKKTIEGAIGGWLCGAIISFAWACYFNYFGMGMSLFIICSLLLPVVSQIGDLTFSLIKRHYDIKDFSKLIPGHGGILDRLDSMSFVLIVFVAIVILTRI